MDAVILALLSLIVGGLIAQFVYMTTRFDAFDAKFTGEFAAIRGEFGALNSRMDRVLEQLHAHQHH